MLFALPVLSCYGLAPTASRSASAARWLASAAPLERELALLPFALTDALHPGETREVHVFEDRFVDGLSEAVGTHGCVGAALFDEDGSLCDISTILEVEDFRPSSTGGWARLRSVGRCRLTEVRAAGGGLARAHVELYTDRGAAPAPDAELRKVHAAVSAQRRRLWELLSVEGDPNQATEAEAEQLYVGPDVRGAPFGLFYGGTSPFVPHPAAPPRLVRTSGTSFATVPAFATVPVSATVSRPRCSFTTHAFVHPAGAEEEVYEVYDDNEVYEVYDDDDDEEEEEYVYVGERWERGPEGCGLCFFNCRDPGELDDEENG